MPLYHLVAPGPGTIYIRNFSDRGDLPLYPHTHIHTPSSVHRIEVTLIPGQRTNIKQLIAFTQDVFSNGSLVCLKKSSFHYIAQIDWSLLRNHYDINKLIDTLSCRHGLVYRLAFTNIIPGGKSFRHSELYITSTGTTRLRLPIHAFLDDSLVTYLSTGLPSPLTEIHVEDTLPIDQTTLSWACRNLARLLENHTSSLRHATFSITLPNLHDLIPSIPRLYDLTLTLPKSSGAQTLREVETNLLSGLSSRSSNITILTLPAIAFTLRLRDTISTSLRRLQELKIDSTHTSHIPDFTHLPLHRPNDFKHLRCLTFSGGILTQFISLLPTLFPDPSPSYPASPRASTSSSISLTPNIYKFINLTLHIPYLTHKHDIFRTCTAINAYIPRIDIVKLHVNDWGPGEPKGGRWWTKAPVYPGPVVKSDSGSSDGATRLPGRVMSDFTHPCRKDVGCKAKPIKVRRLNKRSHDRDGRLSLTSWIGGIWSRWWRW